jgi:hypothetical protein
MRKSFPIQYFSLNKDKKTRLIYLGRKHEAKTREYSENYRRLPAIIEEMTTLNMELLRHDTSAHQAAEQRPENL